MCSMSAIRGLQTVWLDALGHEEGKEGKEKGKSKKGPRAFGSHSAENHSMVTRI